MEIEWSDRAVEGMELIADWIASKFSPTVAAKSLDAIYTRASLLGNLPRSGMIDPYFEHLGKGHRFVMKEHSRIVYLILEDKLVITNVFDMRMNPDTHYQAGRLE
jgi:toxin ParE1/3/4